MNNTVMPRAMITRVRVQLDDRGAREAWEGT